MADQMICDARQVIDDLREDCREETGRDEHCGACSTCRWARNTEQLCAKVASLEAKLARVREAISDVRAVLGGEGE